MRVDVVSIFPAYLEPLRLSLPGRAITAGLLDLSVHDLRRWTSDRHRTVDDTPYGGGAGMVMRPEPWGQALDELVGPGTVVIVPTPSGERFDQRLAAELSAAEHLVVACGRYEGIDQRVLDHARTRATVREVSLGDYVLNGGEVAALAVLEAVVRLLPGVLGNPESLTEESHAAGGLLEYPVFTKPPSWRGLDVPPVLLSGDHARIARWRHDQSLRRTAERRPDLLHPSRVLDLGGTGVELAPATVADAPEILTLQLACWVTEALANATLEIPPLHEDLATVEAWLGEWTAFTARSADRLVGGVRGRLDGEVWHIGRLMVAPDLRGLGLGRLLLEHAEAVAPPAATRFSLVTGAGSESNLRRYRRAGYRPDTSVPAERGIVALAKRRRV